MAAKKTWLSAQLRRLTGVANTASARPSTSSDRIRKAPVSLTSLIGLTIVASSLTAFGLLGFQRRDLTA
jgi:putative exporter of polyketide antibiotics